MRNASRSILIIWLMIGSLLVGGASSRVTAEGQTSARHRPHTTPIFDHMAVITIRLQDDAGAISATEVKIAVKSEEHQAGFQYISPEVIEKSLILFVFPTELVTRFHMRNVEAPLDIGFFDSDGRLLDIQEMVPDSGSGGSELHTYGTTHPFRYVLEARAGYFKEHQISAGKGRLLLR